MECNGDPPSEQQCLTLKEEVVDEEEYENIAQTAEVIAELVSNNIKHKAEIVGGKNSDEMWDLVLSNLSKDDACADSVESATNADGVMRDEPGEFDEISDDKVTVPLFYPVRSKLKCPRDCTKCDFKSKSLYRLRHHYRTEHHSELYPCSECNKIFHYPGNLKDHKRSSRILPLYKVFEGN